MTDSTIPIEEKEIIPEEKPTEESAELEDQHNLGSVINNLVHRILDIEECASQFIKAASDTHNKNAEYLKKQVEECQALLNDSTTQECRIVGSRNLRKAIRDINRHNNSSHVLTLEKSLFVNLFSVFDKYIGDLISIIYNKKVELYKNINREVSLSEALQYDSIETLREIMLDKEIESIRRKSYQEQFKDLESKFSVKLTKFDDWPIFIECAQRRNLFTHCDGVVSKQYLKVCSEVGYKFKKEPEIGEQLTIGGNYFFKACFIVTEVAVMLGQTLWRKTFPEELEKADLHLHRLIFDYLHMEHWGNAISLSKFALGLPEISSDQIDRISTVNYAIALKAIGKQGASKNVLDKKDWSASTYDFKLAYAVLTEDYKSAKDLMIKIGQTGELIVEMSYHDWPLFREFREQDEFFSGYEEVYGYKYSDKLSSLADEAKSEVEELNVSNPSFKRDG